MMGCCQTLTPKRIFRHSDGLKTALFVSTLMAYYAFFRGILGSAFMSVSSFFKGQFKLLGEFSTYGLRSAKILFQVNLCVQSE